MAGTSLILDPAWNDEAPLPQPVEIEENAENQWPRLINLDTDTRDRLTQFLDYELEQCFTERDLLIADWKQWQVDYWAKPETPVKNFPFRKAANVVIPMTAIAVEAVYARLMNTLFSVEPFWSIRPRSTQWVQAAPIIEQWLQSEAEGPLDVYGFCRESLLELVKLGTAVGKTGYQKIVKKSNITLNKRDYDRFVTTFDGTTLDWVPLANFLIRFGEKDPQTAIWVGEEHTFNWSQVKQYCHSGRWRREAVDEIKSYWTTNYSEPSASGDYNEAIDQAAKTEITWFETFRTYEIWMSFDVDGDGYDEEIVVEYHKDSRTPLSVRYNWYDDLHRPYRVGVYIPVEGRIYGIGIGKQNEQFQKLITTVHRQRLDSQTLANMFQIALKKNSGYGPGEDLFPGKMWFLEDPKNDIVPLQLSDPTISQFNHEDYARSYSERRTGVNEVVLGMPQEGTPGTATSDMARLAEGNKKFDLVLRNARKWLGPLGTDSLANYQQFGDNDRHWVKFGPESGQVIDAILAMPPQLVRDGAIVEITVTDSITNKEVQRQQFMAVFTVLTQYYDRQKQNAAQFGSPDLFMMMTQACLIAEDELMRRLLDNFREVIIDPKPFLLYPKLGELLNARAEQYTSDSTGGPSTTDAATRMAQLLIAGGNGGQQSRESAAQRGGQRNRVAASKSNNGDKART